MQEIPLDGRALIGWQGFHDHFAQVFGFADWYGRNQDAWVDAMEQALETDRFAAGQARGPLVLRVSHWDRLQGAGPEQARALVSLVAAVNDRAREQGGPLLLALAPVEGV